MLTRILYLFIGLSAVAECVPKTSQETGNDIEKFLLEKASASSQSPPPPPSQKKPDKFMEDLIEVQRTYRNLKQKWQRMMEEKSAVMRRASEPSSTTVATSTTTTTTTTTSTTTTSPPSDEDVQQIDVDVFEAPDNFQDISDPAPSAFDDVAFVDISKKPSELEEIQLAIREAFGKTSSEDGSVQKALINVGGGVITTTLAPPSLAEILKTSTTRKRSLEVEETQRDDAPTHVQVERDQTTPATKATVTFEPQPIQPSASEPSDLQSSEDLLVASRAQNTPGTHQQVVQAPEPPRTLLSTFGTPGASKVATEWRRKLPLEVLETAKEDPFEVRTTVPLTTSTTPIPLHILPKSTFHSSGSNPDALPATNLFRYPDQVQIPFFGASEASGGLQGPMERPRRPTTPEPPGVDEEEEEEVEVTEAEYDGNGSEDVEEITAGEGGEEEGEMTTTTTTTAVPIEKNEDYIEETFSKEVVTSSEATEAPEAPEDTRSFGIGKAPEAPEDFGSSGGSFGIGKAPEFPEALEAVASLLEGSDGVGSAPGSAETFGSFGSPPGSMGSAGSSETFGSPPGASEVVLKNPGSSLSPSEPSEPFSSFGNPPGSSFGIGRAPPGSSELPRAPEPQKPPSAKQFPTLINQEVESFFADESTSSSALGSFGSAEVLGNIAVEQHLEILEDPTTTTTTATTTVIPTTVRPKPKRSRNAHQEPVGIFGTKIATINERAYRPPMFPSPMSSRAVRMPSPRNPYLERTTIPPIGPHGLAEAPTGNDVFNSVDTELPALGTRDHGIMNRARREYQKEFEQQIRDVRLIDEEISRISQMNDDGRSKSAQRCSQIYAHTLSLPQIQQMSSSLGLSDVAIVIRQASDLTDSHTGLEDISQLEVDLEEKRRLIAKVEILLSLAESRALLYDLLKEQKKIAEKMENRALDMLQKTNFRPAPPSVFSAANDISELSSAVQQVLGGSNTIPQKKGRSMMKKKVPKSENKIKKSFEVVPETALVASKKTGHLQETAEIVEPVLSSQNDQFGRQPQAPMIIHRRPLPLAPPTMSPMAFSFGRPAQRAAHRLSATQPITPPRFTPPTDDQITESDTVHELIDMLHEDIVKLPEEEQERVCRQVQCDFEKADLCSFESSHDETTRLRKKQLKLRKRDKREADLLEEASSIADDLLPYTFRAWSIWAGRRADRQKQIDIGPDFSPHNTHFAAVFLEPQQAGILSAPLVLSGTATRIRLRLFEGTRGMRLRVCCDRYCPLETELGIYRGHRKWLRKTVTCPANTQTLSFECLNDGPDRGACGVDEVFVDSPRCHHFFEETDQS